MNATSGVGAVAAMAEERKLKKYHSMSSHHIIMQVVLETLGAVGPRSLQFLKDLSNRIRKTTGVVKAHQYLLQQLSVAVECSICFGFSGGYAWHCNLAS